jgi:hypothetical protein
MDKPTAWQWRDTGSGPGHLQRIYATAEGHAQTAYRAVLDHLGSCPACTAPDALCEAGQGLRVAYREARDATRH